MLFLDDDDTLPEEPSEAECKARDRMRDEELAAIDARLIARTRRLQSKVAAVVHHAIKEGGFSVHDEGIVHLHVRRLVALVKEGRIVGVGDLRRPRFSEVRLPR